MRRAYSMMHANRPLLTVFYGPMLLLCLHMCLFSAGRDRFDWEEQLQGVAKEAKESAADSPTALSSSAFGDSGDLDDPIQISVAERQQGGGKRGWFGRANKDQPKPARPTGEPDEAIGHLRLYSTLAMNPLLLLT